MYTQNNLLINEKGHLSFCGIDTLELAKKYGTPLYLLDEEGIRIRCRIYRDAMKKYFGGDSMPLFASKALSFKRVYEIINEEGIGTDIVSSGELYTAMKAGFPMSKAFFHGNNKTTFDIQYAMDCKLGCFVCDNEWEINEINAEAGKRGIKQKVILRLSPGIDPHTHKSISTGSVDSKFGVAIETGQAKQLVKYVLTLKNIELRGFHCHIGSQIFEFSPFVDAAKIMLDFVADMKKSFGFVTKELNLGGGMGIRYLEEHPQIDYAENIKKIAELIKDTCSKCGIEMPTILMEPGRSIVADNGITLYTAGGIKEITGFKNYVSVDGGMPDNPRYALYQSPYTVVNASKADKPADYLCTVAGRCCESGDLLQEDVKLQKPDKGDVIAVLGTGAYNYSMASNYNRIPKPPVVLVDKYGNDYIGVKRETFEDVARNDI